MCASFEKKIETLHPDIRIVLTRFPGEALEPLQNANLANRLGADCYITLHFYQEAEAKPQLYIYYYSNNPLTDRWKNTRDNFAFIPYDQAHKEQSITTKKWGELMIKLFEGQPYCQQFDAQGLWGIPHKSLVGILAPAFCVEAGLKKKDDWQVYVQPLVHALSCIIQEIRNNNHYATR